VGLEKKQGGRGKEEETGKSEKIGEGNKEKGEGRGQRGRRK